jgi:hypothetical protein
VLKDRMLLAITAAVIGVSLAIAIALIGMSVVMAL